jgi:hypothetical protein
MSPCPWDTPKSQLSKNAEQKGAPKQYGITTGSRSDPNPRKLKRSSLPKNIQGSIAFGTQKLRARHCHQISFILAAAHSKSVNKRKTHRAIIWPDCDRVSKSLRYFCRVRAMNRQYISY